MKRETEVGEEGEMDSAGRADRRPFGSISKKKKTDRKGAGKKAVGGGRCGPPCKSFD